MSGDFARFESELLADPALTDKILRKLPQDRTPECVLIRCDAAYVNKAVCRAIALAATKHEVVQIELVRDENDAKL